MKSVPNQIRILYTLYLKNSALIISRVVYWPMMRCCKNSRTECRTSFLLFGSSKSQIFTDTRSRSVKTYLETKFHQIYRVEPGDISAIFYHIKAISLSSNLFPSGCTPNICCFRTLPTLTQMSSTPCCFSRRSRTRSCSSFSV